MASCTKEPLKIEKPHVLLGEGIDEEAIFNSIVRRVLQREDIQVTNYNGKNNLPRFLKALPTLVGIRNLKSLILTRDADTDFQAAFQSVCSALHNAQLMAQEQLPTAVGQVNRSTTGIVVGVWIFPAPNRSGMIEDTFWDLLCGDDDPKVPYVEQLFASLQSAELAIPTNMSKGRINTWLAIHRDTGKRLGEAVQQRVFSLDRQPFSPLCELIERVLLHAERGT